MNLSSRSLKSKEGYSSCRLTATGTHVPYGITQCYLSPSRGDIPAFTPAEAGTRGNKLVGGDIINIELE